MTRLLLQLGRLGAAALLICRLCPAAAEVPVYDNYPPGCSNEKKVFTSKAPAFPIGPTWVARCDDFCDAQSIKRAVWYPTSICSGSVITKTGCIADSSRPGCSIVVPLPDLPLNFDCAKNEGGAQACSDRPVESSCSYTAPAQKEAQDFTRRVSRAYCVQQAPPAESRDSSVSIRDFWIMDWSDYGPIVEERKSGLIENELRVSGGSPSFDRRIMRRFYWEEISLNQEPIAIPSGPIFYLYSAAAREWSVGLLNAPCSIRPVPFAGRGTLSRVECLKNGLPDYYYQPVNQVPLEKQHRFAPGSGDPLDPNFDLGRPLPYSSYAHKFWKEAGIELPEAAGAFSAYSAECALIAEKVRFALGYYIKQRGELDLEEEIKAAASIFNPLAQSRDGNYCHDQGRKLPCFFRGSNCGMGWARYWDAYAEFAARNAIYAKAALLTNTFSDPTFKKTADIIGPPGYQVPVYAEPQKVWGGGTSGQMNKVGRIWQFIMNKAVVSVTAPGLSETDSTGTAAPSPDSPGAGTSGLPKSEGSGQN